ncbi:MAG: hypothetical protein ACWA5Q_05050 [bacterium]
MACRKSDLAEQDDEHSVYDQESDTRPDSATQESVPAVQFLFVA